MIRVRIAGLSQETFSFGVATVKDGVESEITWPAQPFAAFFDTRVAGFGLD